MLLCPSKIMMRSVLRSILSIEQSEGQGARVRRSIGTSQLRHLDPFLMLDEMVHVEPPAGFPDHPHRGFQTVTYLLEGEFVHEDFCGHKGTIKTGGLQWMTAGRGIMHSEMPLTKSRGLQLWVNLKSKDKMIEPSYQELEASQIPTATQNGVTVKVIAGESMGIQSPIRTLTPTHYLDFRVEPGAKWTQPTPDGWTVFAYTLSGRINFGSGESKKKIEAHHTVVFGDGESVEFHNESLDGECAHFLLIAGQPIGEPIAQRGPFVMNTLKELERAFRDFHNGTNGFENAPKWRSRLGN